MTDEREAMGPHEAQQQPTFDVRGHPYDVAGHLPGPGIDMTRTSAGELAPLAREVRHLAVGSVSRVKAQEIADALDAHRCRDHR